ncbi:Transcription factor Adf-1 [Nymphon striatum]|nr:Transcription factor Adf-1 [Nymphon striatum]
MILIDFINKMLKVYDDPTSITSIIVLANKAPSIDRYLFGTRVTVCQTRVGKSGNTTSDIDAILDSYEAEFLGLLRLLKRNLRTNEKKMAASQQSIDFSEKLIEEVKRYEWLFNTSRTDFKDTTKKRNSWQEIANTLNSEVDVCEKKWSYLRSKYTKARNLQRKRSGSAGGKIDAPWHFFHQMNFFSNYIRKNNTFSNIYNTSMEEEVEALSESATMSESPSPILEDLARGVSPEEPVEVLLEPQGSVAKKRREEPAFMGDLLKSLDDGNQILKNREIQDEDYHFGVSIGKRLQKFPIEERDDIKIEIMKVIKLFSEKRKEKL